jgi:hypothetical protein
MIINVIIYEGNIEIGVAMAYGLKGRRMGARFLLVYAEVAASPTDSFTFDETSP